MPAREEVEAALRTISHLADDHGRALDRAFRVLADGAIVGPYAVELERRMLAEHGAVRSAFTDAFTYVRWLAQRDPQGPPRVRAPHIPPPPVGYAPARGGAVGGDTELLEQLDREFGRAGRAWQSAASVLGRTLARMGVDQLPARTVAESGRWVAAQPGELRRRRAELIKSDDVGGTIDPLLAPILIAQLASMTVDDPRLAQRMAAAGVDRGKVPLGRDPRSVAAWWQSLDQRQRALYVQAFPHVIGWLDGVPSTARDTANRLVLTRRIATLKNDPARGEFQERDLSRLQKLENKLDDLKARGVEAYLLGLDSTTEGPWDGYGYNRSILDKSPVGGKFLNDPTAGPDGRVIVAIGNPDKADHTGIYVPGTTTQLDGFGGEIDRIGTLEHETRKYAGDQRVSMIAWLGYDAPDSIVHDAGSGKYADAGGPTLDRFVRGVRAAQGDTHRHVTMIGHSYGSTVIGEAARTGNGLTVDDIVVAGSPGMRVSKATKLHMTRTRVWSEAAEGDLVPLGGIAHGGGGIIPKVPADKSFGAQRLATDTHGHTDYWKENSLSLANQARVVAGTHFNAENDDDPRLLRS